MSEPDKIQNTNQNITKWSVSQLRALCRDRKLHGYSKLTKAALLQILGAVPATAEKSTGAKSTSKTKTLPTDQPPQSSAPGSSSHPVASPSRPQRRNINTVNTDPRLTQSSPDVHLGIRNGSPVANISSSIAIDSTASANAPIVPVDIEDLTPGVTNSQLAPSGPDASRIPSSSRPSVPGSSSSSNNVKRRGPLLPPLSPFKKSKTAHTANSSLVQTTSVAASSSAVPSFILQPPMQPSPRPIVNQACSTRIQTLKTGGTRFKPLLLKKPLPPTTSWLATSATPARAFSGSTNLAQGTNGLAPAVSPVPRYLDLAPAAEVPNLSPITMPPGLSQRKRVQHWAVILSQVRPVDRKNCCLVSRMFRYALYLSAVPILKRDFAGQRLDDVLRRYSPSMSNFWPYLSLRLAEVRERRSIYQNSFLGQLCRGSSPVAAHLWASGDHTEQLTVAFRFLLTRLWFSVSFTGKEHQTWMREQVIDIQPVIYDQIWNVKVRKAKEIHAHSFYVLAPTCEVVGHASAPSISPESGTSAEISPLSMRADWSAFIEQHASDETTSSLLARLKWAHLEEYDKGISKLWLKRIEFEGELGATKRRVAERYVLACVVGNSISGHWMSTVDMAQESAGLASRMPGTNKKEPEINLFLPAHHHVESVHFTTAKHVSLHPAVAAVQTLAREYFVLRDNGMEIGCEEEGIKGIWMQMLRCSDKGLTC